MGNNINTATHLLTLFVVLIPILSEGCKRPPVLFNFGDSNSDTGGFNAAFGYTSNPPYGRAFFHRPTGRFCDGRLVIDFMRESLNASYLSPYLEGLGSDFQNGANFAIVGSKTLPENLPFSLFIQTLQFKHFKSRSLELVRTGKSTAGSRLVDERGFNTAVYMFDIGQNDLSDMLSTNLSHPEIIKRIPSIISQIKLAINSIYREGGRRFWVHNTGPLGCLPQKLSSNKDGVRDLDAAGCLKFANNIARRFNAQLESLCRWLQSELKNTTVVYTDVYDIKYQIILHHSEYGFENPLQACCGSGGAPYNYDPMAKCGDPGSNSCSEEGSKRISWDGIHYTEEANAVVANKILSGDYSKPSVKFDSFCLA